MTYFKNYAVIFLEVNEPHKAPDLRFITVGSSEINNSDEDFKASAVAYFKEGKSYPAGTTFNLKGVQRFNSQETYIKFLQNQISDYLDSLK